MKKKAITLLALVLLLTIAVTGTVAYLVTSTNSVTNTFTPSKVTTEVYEDTTSETGVKKDVQIQNTGDTDAYIRAAIVVNLVDADGNISATVPVAGTHYTMTLATNTGWTKGSDGYYYYKGSVAPQDLTGILIASCEEKAVPAGYHLQVTIIAEGIQSKPDAAVTQAWGEAALILVKEVSNA